MYKYSGWLQMHWWLDIRHLPSYIALVSTYKYDAQICMCKKNYNPLIINYKCVNTKDNFDIKINNRGKIEKRNKETFIVFVDCERRSSSLKS